jgi:UDP-N-acetylglucosamine 4-epimerase
LLISSAYYNAQLLILQNPNNCDLQEAPRVETRVGKVLSPNAATKMATEFYAEAYAQNYDMTICGFRYVNVFGIKQDPDGPY